MLTLVQQARRRLFHNELFAQGTYAAVAILVAFIILLLIGTGILDWRWTLLVTVVAVGVALYRSRKHLLSPYLAAQVIDRRMELADTISTAVFFEQDPAHASPELREFQKQRANQAAATVDVRMAVPYRMPHSAYLMVVLTLVAGSLFGLRYGLLGHLDLQPPLVHMLAQELGWKDRTEVAKNDRKPPRVPEPQDDPGAAANEQEQRQQQMQPDTNTDGADNADSAAEKGDSTKGDAKKDGNRANQQSADGDQEAQAESNPSQSDQKAGDKSGRQEQKQQSGGKPDPNNAGENSSLMNKAKDMIQNLLSSLKPPSSNPGDQQHNDQNQNKGQQKQADKNGQQKNSGQKGEQSQDQQGEQSQDQQDQSQQSNGKNDSQQATKQPGSGAGNQDGEKRIKQAEDQAAMGKITEILGKRSANLTGEATVEVKNTSQQLKTAYATGTAQHGQSGGEINRDEIPVAMEPFVQEYFKQARKQDAAAPAAPTPAAPPAKKQN